MTIESILTLRQYGAAFGEKVVLDAVDLAVPTRGVVVLMGPAGTGKSTLLRALAGIANAVPSFRAWGEATYAGRALGEGDDAPALVAQNAKLMMASVLENMVHDLPERNALTPADQTVLARRLLEHAGLGHLAGTLDSPVVGLSLATQRHLAIARTVAANPRLVCIDEPTADLSDAEARVLLEYLRREAERRALIVVLHNQKQARLLGGRTALLAGGWIQECRETADFFDHPEAPVTRDFIRTGSCSVPSPNARPDELDESARTAEPPALKQTRHFVSDSFGPRGFLWLKQGLLAGTPRPGVFLDVDYDLRALQRVRIKVLVSLTETRMDTELLEPYGIAGLWLPIEDMGAPTIEEAMALCSQVEDLLTDGQAVAYHCKAGLGRTGTMLAAQLIWEGNAALDALESVRRIEPRWVQSQEQVDFLERFAEANKTRRPSTLAS